MNGAYITQITRISRLYPGFVMPRETIAAYWEYLHGQCGLSPEAIRRGLDATPKHSPTHFPTAAVLREVIEPIEAELKALAERAARERARAELPPDRVGAMRALLAAMERIDASKRAEDLRLDLDRCLQLLSLAVLGTRIADDDPYGRIVLDTLCGGFSTASIVRAIGEVADGYRHLPPPGCWTAILTRADASAYDRHKRGAEPETRDINPRFAKMRDRWQAENNALGLGDSHGHEHAKARSLGVERMAELLGALSEAWDGGASHAQEPP